MKEELSKAREAMEGLYERLNDIWMKLHDIECRMEDLGMDSEPEPNEVGLESVNVLLKDDSV
jgi:hypothetical protein